MEDKKNENYIISQDTPKCALCGETMPPGEEMFMYHGYSGPCPKKEDEDN